MRSVLCLATAGCGDSSAATAGPWKWCWTGNMSAAVVYCCWWCVWVAGNGLAVWWAFVAEVVVVFVVLHVTSMC